MKSVLMPDEQSRWKQLHILPSPQELSLENISPKWALRLKRKYTNFYVTDLVTMAL
jgi:hypothetical protein